MRVAAALAAALVHVDGEVRSKPADGGVDSDSVWPRC